MNKNKGFTLIEVLLYLLIVATFAGAVSTLLVMGFQARVKNKIMAEVDEQGIQIMSIMLASARLARTISFPPAGGSGPVLRLSEPDPAFDPSVFDLSGGVITLAEGATPPLPLNNNLVTAAGLYVSNLSPVGTPGSVKIQFTLAYKNPEGRPGYNYSKTFFSGATLRGN